MDRDAVEKAVLLQKKGIKNTGKIQGPSNSRCWKLPRLEERGLIKMGGGITRERAVNAPKNNRRKFFEEKKRELRILGFRQEDRGKGDATEGKERERKKSARQKLPSRKERGYRLIIDEAKAKKEAASILASNESNLSANW